jgi:hypothetical protein
MVGVKGIARHMEHVHKVDIQRCVVCKSFQRNQLNAETHVRRAHPEEYDPIVGHGKMVTAISMFYRTATQEDLIELLAMPNITNKKKIRQL